MDEAAGGGGGVHTLCVRLGQLDVDWQLVDAERQLDSEQPGAAGAGSSGAQQQAAGGSAAAPADAGGTVMGALPTSISTLSVFAEIARRACGGHAGSEQPAEQPSLRKLVRGLLVLLRQPRASPLRVVVCTDAELSAANKALIEEVVARQPHLEVGYRVRVAKQRRGPGRWWR